jgi:hypothetical protein
MTMGITEDCKIQQITCTLLIKEVSPRIRSKSALAQSFHKVKIGPCPFRLLKGLKIGYYDVEAKTFLFFVSY